jgi:predicted deacylase
VTSIRSEVDLDLDGRQIGFLRLPHSVHRSAYGWIPVPVASIRNGDGPSVLIMAGNHGDEYEGQILTSALLRELDPGNVTGQLIMLPMANFPAADAGLRTSPIDQGNLNRCFPGDANGTPTAAIAHYIEEHLLPRVQVVVDLHSGGSSLLYDGGNLMMLEPRNPSEALLVRAYASAFGLPRTLLHNPNPPTIAAAARRQGAISMVTELGGAGAVSPPIMKAARAGLLHFLGSIGLLHGDLVPAQAPGSTRWMRSEPLTHWSYASERGLFEPLVELGQWVQAGEPAARLHFPATPWREPQDLAFEGAGQVVCKRVPALVQRGDCLFQLAGPIEL